MGSRQEIKKIEKVWIYNGIGMKAEKVVFTFLNELRLRKSNFEMFEIND